MHAVTYTEAFIQCGIVLSLVADRNVRLSSVMKFTMGWLIIKSACLNAVLHFSKTFD